MWDEIIPQLTNLIGSAIEVWEWISNPTLYWKSDFFYIHAGTKVVKTPLINKQYTKLLIDEETWRTHTQL